MKLSKRQIISFSVIIILTFILSTFQLPYYIYKPGSADPLDPIVEVADGYESQGDMHLVTVSGGQATPIQYLWAKIRAYHEILPIEEVRPEGLSDEDYMHVQLQMMENSQESSTVVAYEAAGADIEIEFNGVYVVSVIEGMPADGILDMGDRITGIDGNTIKEADDLIDYINDKSAGDIVNIVITRDEEQITRDVKLESFAELDDKIGIGIQLVTDRSVQVDPKVNFLSGNIGGPSAGLMFALEIYDQLIEEDLTKGYQLIGTGEIDYDGTVHRIGGVDKKVVAADKAGGEVFFVPNEAGAKGSNYEEAKKTAKDIKTKMKIVPIDHFTEAVEYLENLAPKS